MWRVGVRMGEVQHVLAPRRRRGGLGACAQDPLRVLTARAGCRRSPSPAPPTGRTPCRASARALRGGPGPSATPLDRHGPVAETCAVVAAAAEPAVVEHEALDADVGRAHRRARSSVSRSWSKYTASQVLSVTGRGRRGCCGRAAQLVVEAARQLVEPVAPRADHPRRRVATRPGASTTSPGPRSSPPARNASPVGARSASERGGCRSTRRARRGRGPRSKPKPGASGGEHEASRRRPGGRAGSRARGCRW